MHGNGLNKKLASARYFSRARVPQVIKSEANELDYNATFIRLIDKTKWRKPGYFIPAFELGVWNAWILTISYLLSFSARALLF
jgi:hypothetical protein